MIRRNFRFFSKVYVAIFIQIAIIIIGSLGYMVVEGWTPLESFYMTIITVTTVGFGEVRQLSDGGQLFTAFLIIASFGTFTFAASAVTSYIAAGEYKKYFSHYKTLKQVSKMENHTIICGYGRVGKQVAAELKTFKEKFIVVESNHELEKYQNEDFLMLIGDATEDEVLEKAGIATAKALITALPKDADNLFVVLSAKELNDNLKIISRASTPSSIRKLRFAGANHVIMPDTVGGTHMASLVISPDLIEFMDRIKVTGQSKVNLEEISFQELPADMQFCTINDIRSKSLEGCNIIGYRSPEGEYIINPVGEIQILPKSKLFVLGNSEQIKQLNQSFGIHT